MSSQWTLPTLEQHARKVFENVSRDGSACYVYAVSKEDADDEYFAVSDAAEVDGPHEFIEDALSEDHLFVTTGTERIWCDEIGDEYLIDKLVFHDFGGEQVTVNGELVTPTPSLSVLQDRAETVFSNVWEGGIGSYAAYVFKFNGYYYSYDMMDEGDTDDDDYNPNQGPPIYGPYESLIDALFTAHVGVSSATVSVASNELSFDELITLLRPDAAFNEPISVNGVSWSPLDEDDDDEEDDELDEDEDEQEELA